MDELRERLEDLESFVEQLQFIASDYEKIVDKAYIDEITETWSRAEDEAEELRNRIAEKERAEMKEQILEYERSRF